MSTNHYGHWTPSGIDGNNGLLGLDVAGWKKLRFTVNKKYANKPKVNPTPTPNPGVKRHPMHLVNLDAVGTRGREKIIYIWLSLIHI